MHSQYASSSYMIAVDQHCWYQLVYELLQRKSHAAKKDKMFLLIPLSLFLSLTLFLCLSTAACTLVRA